MAEIKVYYDNGWSYSGDNKLNYLGTFRNPSSSERAEIHSLTVNIGTIRGECSWGDHLYGNGNPFSTYMKAGSYTSESLTVSNVVTTYRGSGGYTPNQSQCQPYTFTFSTPAVVSPGSSADLYIWCPSAGNNQAIAYRRSEPYGITVSYTNVPNKKPNPSSVSITCTDFTANSISWKVTTGSTATSCKVYLDDVYKGTYSLSGNTAQGIFSGVSSNVHRLQAYAINGNSEWVLSPTISVDCTIPPINNFSINPTSSNKGILRFTSTYNVNYTLKGYDGITYATGKVNANTNPEAQVSLLNNSTQGYTLYITRIDNTKIGNSKSIDDVSTRVAIISLTGEPGGLLYNFKATSDIMCNNWKYVLKDVNTGDKKDVVYNTVDATYTSGIIRNLKVDNVYELYVEALTSVSGLISKSNTLRFKPEGFARISEGVTGDAGGKLYTVFVYEPLDKKWNAVVPYVWDGNNWVVCV